jgi:hypothetical protein
VSGGSAAAAEPQVARESLASRTRFDRLTAAVPLASVFVWLALLYAWQASKHQTPWLFTDELELTQISRAIAETGEPARRGVPHTFQTLYTYLLAPFWRIDSTETAYDAIKYFGSLVMASVVFPAYFLGRMIASKPAALFTAAASAAIPSLAYSAMILDEPLAYPYATLCLFLMVKALVTRTRWWIAAAVVGVLVAPLVREELAVLVPLFVLAVLGLLVTSERGRAWARSWTAWDWVGAVVLSIGALIVFSAVMGTLSHSWLISTGYYRARMIDYGLWAAGALTIGVGILPVVCGLAALVRPPGERRTPELRAFTAVAVAAIVSFGLYTAVKASYLSTVFATRIEERNLIYLSPVLFAATALWLDRPRLRIVPLAMAAGFAAYLIVSTPFAFDTVPYADAFGLSIVQLTNRDLGFTDGVAQWTLLAALAIGVALLLAPRVLGRRPLVAGGVVALVAVLVLSWNVAGQVAGANASNDFSERFFSSFPKPANWLDRVTGGEDALYLGQKVQDPNGVHLIEFWNRSLKHVWGLDDTTPGPGPILHPDLASVDGRLYPDPKLHYVVTEPGIDLDGQVVGAYDRWRVYKIKPPLRLAHTEVGIFSDGWIGCPGDPCPVARAGYSQYATPGNRPGTASVIVSRAAWRGPDKPGRVVVKIGTLVRGPDKQPALGRVTGVRRWTIHSGKAKAFVLPTPKPPFRVEVSISPTFRPAEYGASSDRRQLGAQVGFGFTPSRG